MARWLVSDGTRVQEVQADAAKVAVGGVVKNVLRACVAENGIVRQFWPPTVVTTNPGIVWDTTALTVTRTVTDPANAIASITFSRDFGTYTYKDTPNADGVALYLNPPATAAGQYLIRMDQVSGTTLTGTEGSWIDLYSASAHIWSLDQIAVGVLDANANISISEDDGGGSPVSATTVVKSVTFRAEVTTESKITWTTDPYDLVEVREGEDADCILTFTPNGWAIGDAFTSGSFTENWHKDAPDLANAGISSRDGELIIDSEAVQINSSFDAGDFTVNATLISGTAPTGSALGVDLTLDQTREWTLLATTGENLVCTLHVTVGDGTTSVTKVITMNSQRSADASSNVWTTAAWSLEDSKTGTPNTVSITIDLDSDGTGGGSNSTTPDIETEDWNSGAASAPDPENYECRITLVSGIATQSGDTFGAWLPLSSDVAWTLSSSIIGTLSPIVDVDVRRVGGATVTKRVSMLLGIEI